MFISAPPTRGGEASGLLTTGTGTAIAVLCVRGRARGVARTQVLTGCLASAMIRVVTYWRARGPGARIRSSKLEIRSEAASKPKPKRRHESATKRIESNQIKSNREAIPGYSWLFQFVYRSRRPRSEAGRLSFVCDQRRAGKQAVRPADRTGSDRRRCWLAISSGTRNKAEPGSRALRTDSGYWCR